MYGLGPHIRRGWNFAELLKARYDAGMLPYDPVEYEERVTATFRRGEAFITEAEMPDGRIISVVNRPTKEGGWVATHEDITVRKRAERELENTRAFLDMIVENAPSPIIVKDASDLRYLLVNRATEDYFGIDRAKIMGKKSGEILPKGIAGTILAEDRKAIETGEIRYQGEHGVATPGNGTRIVTATRLPVKDIDGTPKYLITVIHDITERKRSEQRIAHLAHHDALTDLPNRAAFNECIDATIALAAADRESFGVLCIDLDRFKAVNDVFGHPVGDALLREAARRHGVGAATALSWPAPAVTSLLSSRRRHSSRRRPNRWPNEFTRLSNPISPSAVIRCGSALPSGLLSIRRTGADAATLVANANAALFRAKSEARGSIRFFEIDMDKQLREKRALQQDLRKAVEQNELVLHYMPQARHRRTDHRLRGVGALASSAPRPGPAGCFHSARGGSRHHRRARRMGVARGSAVEAVSWPNKLHIAVNLSPVQFQHGDLPEPGASGSGSTPASAPARLELEITEGVPDRRLHPCGRHVAPAQEHGRARRHGRFRHRLFIAVVSAVVSFRQDQDRPRLRRQSRP